MLDRCRDIRDVLMLLWATVLAPILRARLMRHHAAHAWLAATALHRRAAVAGASRADAAADAPAHRAAGARDRTPGRCDRAQGPRDQRQEPGDRAQEPRDRLARCAAGEDQPRAGAAEALEVRRQDRGHDGAAAGAVCRDARRGRGQPAGAAGRAAGQAPTDARDAEGRTAPAAPPGVARTPAARGASPRAGRHALPERRLRRAHAASGRGRQREARHHSGAVLPCTATSTASGPAGAASSWCRSRPSPTWSMAASRPVGWWRTR